MEGVGWRMRGLMSNYLENKEMIMKEMEYEETEDYCAIYGWCCNAGDKTITIGNYTNDIITFALSIILLLTLCFLILKLSLNYITLQVITFKPNGFQVGRNKYNNNNKHLNINDDDDDNNEEEILNKKNKKNKNKNKKKNNKNNNNKNKNNNNNNNNNNNLSYSTFSCDEQSSDDFHANNFNNYKINFSDKNNETLDFNHTNNNNNNNNDDNNHTIQQSQYNSNAAFFTSSDTSLPNYSSFDRPKRKISFQSPTNNENNNNNNNENSNENNKKNKNSNNKNKITKNESQRNFLESSPNFAYTQHTNFQLRSQSLRPIHYLYILIVFVWLLLQSLILLLPISVSSSPFLRFFDTLLYEIHLFLDNGIIFLSFFANDRLKSVIISAVLSTTLVILLSFTGVFYDFFEGCSICEIFFPAPQSFYVYLLLSFFYLSILLFSSSSLSLRKPRNSILIWVFYLFLIYSFASFASALILFWQVDAGFCLIDLIVFVYTLSYAPLLYYALLKDSNLLYEMEESLIDQLDPSDTEAITERAKELCERYKIGLIPFHYLLFGERLGIGAAGEVYKANYLGTPIAVKRLFDTKSQALEDFFREVTVMSKLSHPNIILFMGVSISSQGDRYIITEIMDKGSVFDLIHPNLSFSAIRNPDSDNDLTGPRIKRILIQCARGIAYLHSFQPPILHRDLKSHNLLVDNNWNVKVADFGLSRAQSLTAMTAAGTPQWSAPEVIRQDFYTEKADVFSFGVIIFELLSKEIPYANMGPLTAAHQVAYEGLRLRFPSNSDNGYVQLAEDCWEENPADRPNFTDIVKRLEVMPPPLVVVQQKTRR